MRMNPALNEARDTFFAESREMLMFIEETLLALENKPADEETINALFRAAHTIKGSAGLFDFDRVVSFTHVVENVLQRVRDAEITFVPPLAALLLVCADQIGVLLTEADADCDSEQRVERNDSDIRSLELAGLLGNYLETPPPSTPRSGGPLSTTEEATAQPLPGGGVAADHWHISVRFGPDVLRNGMDPLSLIRYLGTLGSIVSVSTLFDRMPAPADMDAESCYLGFEIGLSSTADRKTIAETFDFVRSDCELRILPPHSKIAEYVDLINALPEDPLRLGEILVKIGSLTEDELQLGLSRQNKAQDVNARPVPLGEILLDQASVQAPVLNAALEKQQRTRDNQSLESRFIRVRADKLDQLINLVAELVVASASVKLRAQRAGDPALTEASSSLTQLVEQIRDDALQLRMVQIAETFGRFNRVVRDTARELGKEIELQIQGGETELDKSMVEKLVDPLMHLVRNSMDHGLESPADRQAAGKPVTGSLRLNAYHDSGSIVIEVADDGAGLSRDRILKKGIERGLVTTDQQLSDDEIYNLIFAPGFSTAAEVTKLSGRGVGMDVVKRNIQALRGVVSLHSTPGKGTTIAMRLPLTLAIIDGFLVSVLDAMFVVPLDLVVECIELPDSEAARGDYLSLRGEVLPFLRLRHLFPELGATGSAPAARRMSVVVVRIGQQKAGLLVDALHGEFHTVIKPLGRLFQNINGISDATVLASGEVALVLDVPALIRDAGKKNLRAAAPA